MSEETGPRKIVAYGNVQAVTSTDLATMVHGTLKDGWQPFGSVVVFGSVLVQPLVRYEPTLIDLLMAPTESTSA